MSSRLTLTDGSRVAIIGGGPSGSFFAHFIQKFAQQKGIRLSTTIFDGKDFLLRGPKGCNLCAGVIAESLNKKLKEEGIFLPEKRIINRVEGYCLHIEKEKLHLSCAENKKNTIATVFRGNGPRFSTFPWIISFDDFLLSWAQDHGTEVIPQPIWEIKLPEAKSNPALIYFGKKDNPDKYEADLIVGAFGINTHLTEKIQELGFGYKPPSTLVTFQSEIKLGQEKIADSFGNLIHIYMPKSRSIRYATIIPKGEHITITLIGKNDARKGILSEFLCLEDVRNIIPPWKPHCLCYPRIVTSSSKNPFADRLVMVGDAGFSRHYKNGIESAFQTSKLAALTAINHGIDSSSFSAYYYKQAKRLIGHDNYYGRFLLFVNDIISSIPILTQSHFILANKKDKMGPPQKIRFILWNMSTGNIPYKDIFKSTLDIRLQLSIVWNIMKAIIQKLKILIKRS
jgi:flavin-dependent dehydrogenase